VTADAIQRRYLKNVARLRRINRALSVWDEWDAADLLPLSLRQPIIPPLLDREQRKTLRIIMMDELADLELLYGQD
jgi:hypothetical protein